MRFAKNLYLSPNIRHPKAMKWRLQHGAGNLSAYVVMLSGERIEFMHCAFLHESYYRQLNPLIVGIAEGRWEAIELIRQMVQDAYDSTGTGDAGKYLSRRISSESGAT